MDEESIETTHTLSLRSKNILVKKSIEKCLKVLLMFPRIKRRLRQVPTTAKIMANIPANTENRFQANSIEFKVVL